MSQPTPASDRLTPADIVGAVRHLPSSPKVLPRLKHLLRDGNSALAEIVALVRLDTGLAARVLQVANSPYFFTGARCATVDEAVARVGYNEIYALVSHAVAAQVLVRPLTVYGMEAEELWTRSVASALAAQAIAARTGRDGAAAYTLGLLHAIGMVAVDEWALWTGREVQFVLNGLPVDAAESERRVLGFTQAEVGAGLLEQWNFPDEVSGPVRWQYQPESAPEQTGAAAVLMTAKWIAAAATQSGPKPMLPTSAVLRRAGIVTQTARELVAEVGTQLAELSSVLEAVGVPHVDCGQFPGRSGWAVTDGLVGRTGR